MYCSSCCSSLQRHRGTDLPSVMGNTGKASKPDAIKLRKKLKIGRYCNKTLKPVAVKLMDMLSCLMGNLFHPTASQRQQQELAFVSVGVKVNPRKRGWERAIRSLTRQCFEPRFNMTPDGVVQISGIANPTRLLNRIGKWRRLELKWFQYGQCCSDLFYKPAPAAPDAAPAAATRPLAPLAPYPYQYLPTRPFNPYAQPYAYKYY